MSVIKNNRKLFISFCLNLFLLFIILLLIIPKNDYILNHNIEEEQVVFLGNIRNTNLEELKKLKSKCNLKNENYVFLGDSITHRYDLDKYHPNYPTVNSGLEGDTTSNILKNMYERVYKYNPTKVLLLIGTNQLESKGEEDIYKEIIEIVEKIKENRPQASIYIESIYPVDSTIDGPAKKKDNQKIERINTMIKEYADENSAHYIDVYSSLVDNENNLKEEYTNDGLHLTDKGYDKVYEILKKYVEEC